MSSLVKHRPAVRAFGKSSGLLEQLQTVNALAPTEMCRVMTKYGSDKGRGWHNYTTVYSVLFRELRDRPLRIFELGLGSTNPDIESNMVGRGGPGASLRGWRDLFPQAQIYGADIDRDSLFQDNRIETFYCDQLDQSSIRELWSRPELQSEMDIIIEDGLHTFEANVSFLKESLHHLRPSGFYIVEDINSELVERWYDVLENVHSKRYPEYEFAFVVVPNAMNITDNNLLVIRRQRQALATTLKNE
jgi:hypothetical protein